MPEEPSIGFARKNQVFSSVAVMRMPLAHVLLYQDETNSLIQSQYWRRSDTARNLAAREPAGGGWQLSPDAGVQGEVTSSRRRVPQVVHTRQVGACRGDGGKQRSLHEILSDSSDGRRTSGCIHLEAECCNIEHKEKTMRSKFLDPPPSPLSDGDFFVHTALTIIACPSAVHALSPIQGEGRDRRMLQVVRDVFQLQRPLED
eukprot:561507-Hanusia_phi.AAC.2